VDTARLIGLADNPALDFLNTTGVSAGVAVELLGSGPGYLAWLQSEALISAGDGEVIAGRFRAAELDAAAAEARALREWLRPVVTAWASGTAAVTAQVRGRLNPVLAAGRQYAQLEDAGGGVPVLAVRQRWDDARQLLVPPAGAAAQLLAGVDPGLVRCCEGRACTLWFYDRTRTRRRRWCSMAICGNREKNRRHRARENASAQGQPPAGREEGGPG
jgi:predicted RNA-binding Zn ribbon-like protein